MIEKENRQTGVPFYGCPNYPTCEETARHEDDDDCDEKCNCPQCVSHD